jgi:putative membrane protein
MNRTPADSEWHRTSPVAVLFILLRTARQVVVNSLPAVVIVAAAFASGGSGRKALMVGGAILLLVLGVVGAVLSWLRFRFRIAGDRVLVRSGVLKREELTVEFGRIQNVNVREPFYMRPFGLVVLGIDTAGSNQKEILLGGIPKKGALQIRETILSADRTAQDADDPSGAPGEDASLLLSRDTGDIAIYGLTANFILWFLIAIGAVFSAGESSEKMLSWLADRFHLVDLVTQMQVSLGVVEQFLLAAGLVLAVLLLLPLISVLGAVFRHHGYRLSVAGETYSRVGGLLTRHEESLKRHKIQAVVLKQNAVARLFKRSNMQLRVAQAGSGAEGGQLPVAGKATFMVPALHASESGMLLTEFLPGCAPGEVRYSRINRRRLLTVVIVFAAVLSIPATLALGALVSWKFVVVPLLAAALAGLAGYRYWTRAGYAVDGEHGFVRHGFIGTTTTAFPLFKVQRVDISQSPGQRKRGLAHLVVHLASHSMTVHFIAIRDAETFRDLALYHAEASNRAWY